MPKHEQTITLHGVDKEKALAISCLVFEQLGWKIDLAGEDTLVGSTGDSWTSRPNEILVTIAGEILTIRSTSAEGVLFDAGGKNKKNAAAFATAFDTIKIADAEKIEAGHNILSALRQKTNTATQEAMELYKAMHPEGSNLYVTLGIIGINVLIFILMAFNGAGVFAPEGIVHVKWGSNFSPLTLNGDWWRLISNIFLHFGIIHLLMNMYCLYTIGAYLEPLLGKIRYTIAYLCTGVLASIASLWWHTDGVNSAGASGAIFGMYGLFLALLTTKLIPTQVRKSLLQSIGVFIVYNLVYGMKSGVDNAAHVGGLLGGFVFGYIYSLAIKKEREEQKLPWVLPAVVIVTIAISAAYLSSHKDTAITKSAVVKELKDAGYEDSDKYSEALDALSAIEEQALAPMNDTTATDSELKEKLINVSLPLWNQAEERLMRTRGLKISPDMHKKAELLIKYVGLRKKEIDVLNKIIDSKDSEPLIPELNKVREEMNALIPEIQRL